MKPEWTSLQCKIYADLPDEWKEKAISGELALRSPYSWGYPNGECVLTWVGGVYVGPERLAENHGPMIMKDLPAYPCPITGKMITSRSHHRENLKRNGCEVAEPNSRRDNWAQEKADDHARKKLINDILSSNGYH